MNVAPSATFEAVCDFGQTGLTPGVRILDNAGATTTARVTAGITEYPSGSGIYYVSLTAPATAGQYTIAWDNGTQTAGNFATEDLLVTTSLATISAASNLYITLAALKATLNLTGQTTFDDDLTSAISAACRSIDAACGRRFWLDTDATSVRYYTPDTHQRVMIDDLVTLTSVLVDQNGDGTYEETWTNNTDFVLQPINNPSESPARPYESLVRRKLGNYYWPVGIEHGVKVTGQFGWSAVPPEIAQATTVLAGKLFKRAREAPFGIVSFGGADSSSAMRIARTDPDVANLIEGYVRHTPFI